MATSLNLVGYGLSSAETAAVKQIVDHLVKDGVVFVNEIGQAPDLADVDLPALNNPLQNILTGLQPQLIPGENITIENNIISATAAGGGGYGDIDGGDAESDGSDGEIDGGGA